MGVSIFDVLDARGKVLRGDVCWGVRWSELLANDAQSINLHVATTLQ